jgi:hypothetical protein
MLQALTAYGILPYLIRAALSLYYNPTGYVDLTDTADLADDIGLYGMTYEMTQKLGRQGGGTPFEW